MLRPGAALLLLGLVPLAERLLAHLEVWSLPRPDRPGPDRGGLVALLLAPRSRGVPAPGLPNSRER